MSSARRDRLEAEAVRVFRRYQVEVVEALHLCPWAERARSSGAVAEAVLFGRELDLNASLAAIAAFERRPELEIGILLFPEAAAPYPELEWFVSRLSEHDAARRELGTAPFAMAAFHPDAPLDDTDPERLVPFLRRTPDRTVQLVRRAALDRVREGHSEGTAFVDVSTLMSLDLTREDTLSLRERIARANLRTIRRVGLPAVEALLADIRRDRDAAYGALGATP